MDFRRLFEMQEKLDERIMNEHGLQQQNVLNEKILALLVELGELANETRCFKFWSKKGPAANDIILEEYVDGIHFLLSIGIELDVDRSLILEGNDKAISITEQFLHIYKLVSLFKTEQSLANYIQMFQEYLLLGCLLGFTSKQIEEAYMKKNEVNHKRQDQGY